MLFVSTDMTGKSQESYRKSVRLRCPIAAFTGLPGMDPDLSLNYFAPHLRHNIKSSPEAHGRNRCLAHVYSFDL